jgi:hypothetical protein
MDKCGECKYWSANTGDWERQVKEDDNHDNAHGDCHRFPPVRVIGSEYNPESPWEWQHPITYHDDWCGEGSII